MRRVLFLLVCLAPLTALADDSTHPIDRYFERAWKEKGVTPAPRSRNDDFLRRASLDVLGRPPRPAEVLAFQDAPDRDKKIDELLASDEAAEFFADEWIRILIDERFDETLPLRVNVTTFRSMLVTSWKEDVAYSTLVTQLLSATGDNVKQPAVNFLLAALDPKEPPHEAATRTARIFLGQQIQCARCHDHPTEKLTQEDFWAFTAFFSGTKAKARQTFDGYGVKVTDGPAQTIKIPDLGTEVAPRFLDGKRPDKPEHARAELARFVTGSPLLARAVVNRTWAHFLGRGFYRAVDQVSGEAEHEPLLAALCDEFTRGGTSLRKLSRTILTSRVYQLSCEGDPANYAAMALKPQSPVQFLNTLTWVLALDVFLKNFYQQFLDNKALPEQYRQSAVFRLYLIEFVRKLEVGGGVRRSLKLANGKDLQGLVSVGWGRLKEIVTENETPDARIDAIFIALLARAPSADERKRYLDYVAKKKNANTAWEDVYWVVLNSTELLFNH
ncbi:MAG: DUF1549 domain-containing protein [Planctomycetota bacterium]